MYEIPLCGISYTLKTYYKRMKYKFLFIQLFVVGLLVTLAINCKKNETLEKGIAGLPLFTTHYTKDKVWDVQRSPSYPVAGEDWTLSELAGALDATGVSIDWGTGRYVMFVAEVDNTNTIYSLTDDVYTIGTKYSVSLKLYERNGVFVKVVSKWGNIIGLGTKGFMYEVEGDFGTFFPVSAAKTNDVITYRPTTLEVTKVSELNKQ